MAIVNTVKKWLKYEGKNSTLRFFFLSVYQGKGMEQDKCKAETKVSTRQAIPRNSLFNLHSTAFGIR